MATSNEGASEPSGATTPPSSGGRGRTGGRGGGRGRGRGNRNQGGRGAGRGGRARQTVRTDFKGTTPEMRGNVFECFHEHSDRKQFKKTVEMLEEYAKKTLRYSRDLSPLFTEAIVLPDIGAPPNIAADATALDTLMWNEEVKEHVKRNRELRNNLGALYAVAWGQCSEAMKAKIKTHDEYETRAGEHDCAWLLREIRAVTLQFDSKRNSFLSLLDARASFLNCRQGQHQTAESYLSTFRAWVESIESYGGTVSESHELISAQDEEGNDRDAQARAALARDRTLGIAFLRGADPHRYGTLLTELANQHTMGTDNYPGDLTAAYGLLVNYKTPSNRTARAASTNPTTETQTHEDGIMFAQAAAGPPVPGTNGITHPDIECYQCHRIGHYASDCPEDRNNGGSGVQLVQHGYSLTQDTRYAGLPKSWILLDSQSTASVFNNASMLTDIQPSTHTLRVQTNGGHQDSKMRGVFKNLGFVWYNEESIANILSLADVRKVCRVTLDTAVEPALCVHRKDGSIMKFAELEHGLYVFDAGNASSTPQSSAYTFVSSVEDNKKLFTPREIAAADAARTLYRRIGRPSEASFLDILSRNLIRNCPVTTDDAKRALLIYGPDLAVLKGKTTRGHAAPHVPTFVAVPIPPHITEHHRDVTVCMDFFFVQGIPFLHSISRKIGFRTLAQVPNRTKAIILRETRAVTRLYHARELTVRDVHADMEFECIRDDIRPIDMHIVAADSHVGEVERSVRTIKERIRSTVHGLPFKRIPKLMVKEITKHAVQCLNRFPWKNGVSKEMSPHTIITGKPMPDYNNLRIEFGSYAQVFEDNDPTNTNKARTVGAIALTATGNASGDFYFMSLATGARLSRNRWTELPITDDAIARVEALAANERQPLIQEHGLVVEWRPGQTVDDDEYDRDYVPLDGEEEEEEEEDEHYDGYEPIEQNELADLQDGNWHAGPDGQEDGARVAADGNDNAQGDEDANNIDVQDDDDGVGAPDHGDNVVSDDETVPEYPDDDPSVDDDAPGGAAQGAPNDAPNANQQDQGAREEARSGLGQGAQPEPEQERGADEYVVEDVQEGDEDAGIEYVHEDENEVDDGLGDEALPGPYNLRERKERGDTFADAVDEPHSSKSYYPPHQFAQYGVPVKDMSPAQQEKFVFGFVMTQMSRKAGVKKHGKRAEEALMKEFAQLNDLTVFEGMDPNKLTAEQKRGALRAINLIKEKRDGTLKGRTCADGRPQKSLYTKAETASPTVSTDALMLSLMIDAKERRDVATADVAGAYLKADMDDFVIMKLTGDDVRIFCEMNGEYKKFVTKERGVDVLYVRLLKALYGCVKSALLWYELFTGHLQKLGFVLNPYDPCVANRVINGKQCTVAWYVDDNKISHIDSKVVTNIIEQIEERFGKMTVTRGEEHTFLGMDLVFNDNGTVTIQMRDYLEEAIKESGMNIARVAATPAKKNLFDAKEDAARVTGEDADVYHSVVAKLLYVALRARMDILLPVIFLCTRVSKATVEDWAKLKRVLEYVNGTLDLTCTLGADDLEKFRTWVDASFAVHPDMKSHTGGVISFGTGGLLCKSSKQKLNTKSSTEAELVGASDYLPNSIWVKMFMEAQGYKISECILEQDNESAIKLETNGRQSAGSKSRHVHIRYFFIKDRTKSENIKVRHCPTLKMLADFFTKPLQGSLFRKFRDVVLGYEHISALDAFADSAAQERVGRCPADAGSVPKAPGTKKVSWAEVVKGSATQPAREKIGESIDPSLETILLKQSS